MSKNMEIWDQVSKTDPAHTKKVNQRGGFTAIDAHYQIMMATKQFGPIGIGWGYDAQAPIFQEGLIIVPVTMWHGSRENVFGPVYGCSTLVGSRVDPDAPKKATTDAVTKLLSQLGFNADVFLGKFDDNKYVEQRNRESMAQAASQGLKDAWLQGVLDALPENASERTKAEAVAAQIETDLRGKTGLKALNNTWGARETLINRLRTNHQDLWENLIDVFATTEKALKDAA